VGGAGASPCRQTKLPTILENHVHVLLRIYMTHIANADSQTSRSGIEQTLDVANLCRALPIFHLGVLLLGGSTEPVSVSLFLLPLCLLEDRVGVVHCLQSYLRFLLLDAFDNVRILRVRAEGDIQLFVTRLCVPR